MARTIIEELVTIFGFETDKEGAKSILQTYTDLRNLIYDVVNIANRVGQVLVAPLQNVVKLGTHATLTGLRIGDTAEHVQELEVAFRLAGVSSEVLIRSIEHLGRSGYAATTRHKEQILALTRLGFSAVDANGKLKSPTQLFFDMAEAISKIPEAGKRADLAFRVMGESSGQLLAVLSQGPGYLNALRRAAHDSGAVLSNETAASARQLSLWWDLLSLQTEGLQNRIGAGLIPIASRLVGTIGKWVDANRKVIDQQIDKLVGRVSKAIEIFTQVMAGAWRFVKDLAESFGGLDTVVTAIEVVLGGVLLVSVGAVTSAMIKFGASLLGANIGGTLMLLAFGALVVILGLVVQDLESTDSLLKQIWDDPRWKADDPPIIRALKKVTRAIKELKEEVTQDFTFWDNFFSGKSATGRAFGFGDEGSVRDKARTQDLYDQSGYAGPGRQPSFWDDVQRAHPSFPLDKLNSDYLKDEALRRLGGAGNWLDQMNGKLNTSLGLSPGFGQVNTGTSGFSLGDIKLEMHFNGPTDGESVRAAVPDALDLIDERLRGILNAAMSGYR